MSDGTMNQESLTRVKEVMRALVRHGLGSLLAGMGLKRWLPVGDSGHVELETTEDEAAALRKALEELGGGFPVIGLGLATRIDVLPPPYSQELEKLDEGGAVASWADVTGRIESALNRPLESLFEHVEEEPSRTSRMFQVHRARLKGSASPHDGSPVQEVEIQVVKPEVLESVESDLGVCRQALDHIDEANRGLGEALGVDLGRWGVELENSIREELDLTRRAHDIDRLQQILAEFGRLRVPGIVSELVSPTVLVTEYVSSRPLSDVAPTDAFPRIAHQLWRAFLKQFLVEGAFLRDLRWEDLSLDEEGRLVLNEPSDLAFMARETQLRLMVLLLALVERDGDRAAAACIEMGVMGKRFNESAFRIEVGRVVARLHGRPVGEMAMALAAASRRNDIRFPTEVLHLGRMLGKMESLCQRLDPKIDLMTTLRETASDMLSEQVTREFATHRLLASALDLRSFMTDVPASLRRVLGRASSNELQLGIQLDKSKEFRSAIQKLGNRIALGLIIAALIVGSAFLMNVDTGWKLWGYPGFALTGFALATGLGLYVVARILLEDKL
jgi:predicted unusual protein kinase regulating ubiquinone biosynthesis (AarF/ABC1/UbiB family)